MSVSQFFRINTPNIVYEILDDEVVLVNLTNGNYYSIDELGVDIFKMILQGKQLNEIIQAVVYHYVGSQAEIERGANHFLLELLEEELIVPGKGTGTNGADLPFTILSNYHTGKACFHPPVLHKYTDLEDLLLLDPSCDVEFTDLSNIVAGTE